MGLFASTFSQAVQGYQLFWDGVKLKSSVDLPLAYDTETEVNEDKGKIARLVLGTASDGERTVVIGPHQIRQFFDVHKDSYFVAHNCGYDFWATYEHCPEIRDILWSAASENRIADSMLLDQLIWLGLGKGEGGKGEERFFRRGLDSVVKEYLGIKVDKKVGNEQGEYRMRFAELLSVPVEKWKTDVDPGFFEYATTDTRVTYDAYKVMRKRAIELQTPFLPEKGAKTFSMYHDAIERYGPLTEAIQVKGAIALAAISRNGIVVDQARAQEIEAETRKEFEEFIPFLEEHFPQLLQPYKKKEGYKLAKKSGVPCLKNKELQKLFEEWSPELGLDAPLKSKGKLGGTSLSVKDWGVFKDKNEFIKRWVNARTLSKRLGFFDMVHGKERIHTEYNVLMRTGRVSAQSPNVTQLPKDGNFRNCFKASPGKKILSMDYSAVELKTLGTICKYLFGKSVLLDTVASGIDPHAYTAAMFEGMALQDYMKLKKEAPDKFKSGRQAAKACFHPDVLVLTHEGWVKVKDVRFSHEILCFDPRSCKESWHKPLYLSRRENKKVVRLTVGDYTIRVTEDHRMLGTYSTSHWFETEAFEYLKHQGRSGLYGYHDGKVRMINTWDCKTGYSDYGTESEVFCLTVPPSFIVARDSLTDVPWVLGNCNFGVPGGLGKVKLSEYAKANYGVSLSHDQAETFRKKLISEVYPELSDVDGYLASVDVANLARNLCLDQDLIYAYVFENFGNVGMNLYCLQRVLDGSPVKKDGTRYKDYFIGQMWRLAEGLLAMSPAKDKAPFVKDVEKRASGWKLKKYFFGGTAVTLTGRVRKGVDFTVQKNTGFQGLAADGAKLALFEMVKVGHKIVAFIHDQILAEVDGDDEEVQAIKKIMVEEMQGVLNQAVPVEVEYEVSDSWNK